LPACRQALGDVTSQTRSAINNLVVIAFVITPFSVLVPWLLLSRVTPKFIEVFEAMLDGESISPVFYIVRAIQPWATAGLLILITIWWLMALCYVGGPRLTTWFQAAGPRVFDRLQLIVPWQRKRLLRDFSCLLAVLLDSGLNEADALELAARSTANAIFAARARKAVNALREGERLTEAARLLERSGEFQWRLSNAIHDQGGFLTALRGWQESLDARAFQEEQGATQLATTALVLLNGLLIGAVMFAVFGALITLFEQGVLW
jgi:type II secretory pathway component PulF